MQNKQKNSFFLVLGIFLLGACMRTPITSIPSIVGDIAKTLGVSPNSLGILTTLPLICFGVVALIVPAISRRLGNELTIAVAVALLFVGSYLRIVNRPMLFVGTLIVGIAVTFINVLLPAIITENMPKQIGLMTALFTISMALSSTFGAGLSAPIAQATSWQFVVQLLSYLALITLILWLPNLRQNERATVVSGDSTKNPWTNRTAWYLLGYFGLSSFTFYTLVAWLPTIAIKAGIDTNTASLLAGLFQLSAIAPSFFIPSLAERMHNRTSLVLIGALFTIIGVAGLLLPIKAVAYFAIINIILGLATSVTFTLIMTLFGLKTQTPSETRSLSGMAQSLGYLIASIGPVLTGALESMTGSWRPSELVVILVVAIFMTCGILAERKKFIFS